MLVNDSTAQGGSELLLVGGGQHARVVLDALQASGASVIGILDRDPALWGTEIMGVTVTDERTYAEARPRSGVRLVIAVVGFGEGLVRRRLVGEWTGRGFGFATVIHPSATVSPYAELEDGAQVLARAVINPQARISAHAVVNTGVVVEHDCVIEEGVHLSPGVVLGGAVTIGAWAQVGLQATVLPGRRIGEGAIVGAGAVVANDVPANAVVTGVPARVRRQVRS